MTSRGKAKKSNERSKTKGSPVQTGEQEQDEGVTPDLAAVFGRQLQWRLQLASLGDVVVIQCIHASHVKASAVFEKGIRSTAEPPAEQLAEPAPSFEVRLPRAWFTDEEQIKSWFTSVCDAFDSNLYGIMTFEIQHHFADVMRFQLDRDGIHAEDKNTIIEDHIEGQPDVPGDIGTRSFLRILLAARGPNNESPANEYNLPGLIRAALPNLRRHSLTYEGVNRYLQQHFPGYAQANGDSLRKRCKACGVNFTALVREEVARRKAEN
jgi:hypothetical protein